MHGIQANPSFVYLPNLGRNIFFEYSELVKLKLFLLKYTISFYVLALTSKILLKAFKRIVVF